MEHAALDVFLAGVERRALRIAMIATRNRDDALELVQDAMLRLAERYSDRPSGEWPPLFHRILQRRITDWRRRRMVRDRWLSLWGDRDQDTAAEFADPAPTGPAERHEGERTLDRLERAIARLPPRQQQAVLLRAFEGLDLRDTASAMGCSQGSVKTHYSRALGTLRTALGDVLT